MEHSHSRRDISGDEVVLGNCHDFAWLGSSDWARRLASTRIRCKCSLVGVFFMRPISFGWILSGAHFGRHWIGFSPVPEDRSGDVELDAWIDSSMHIFMGRSIFGDALVS